MYLPCAAISVKTMLAADAHRSRHSDEIFRASVNHWHRRCIKTIASVHSTFLLAVIAFGLTCCYKYTCGGTVGKLRPYNL